jgi:hypothetical protein
MTRQVRRGRTNVKAYMMWIWEIMIDRMVEPRGYCGGLFWDTLRVYIFDTVSELFGTATFSTSRIVTSFIHGRIRGVRLFSAISAVNVEPDSVPRCWNRWSDGKLRRKTRSFTARNHSAWELSCKSC